jgi:hypothetical protein
MGLDWDWPEFPPATATRSLEAFEGGLLEFRHCRRRMVPSALGCRLSDTETDTKVAV